MTLLHYPPFLRWAARYMLCRVEGVDGQFALTFDDGPSPRNTPRLLDTLAAHGARATFFVLGRHLRRHPTLARRAVEEGHEIGLHGEGHFPLPLLPRAVVARHLRTGAHAIADITGVWPTVYRPPYGFLTPALALLLRARGYLPVLGDVYPEDPVKPGVARIVRRVVPRVRAGSIVILHDASSWLDFDRAQTIDALDAILRATSAKGLRAVTVSELAHAGGVDRPAHRAGYEDAPHVPQ